MTTVFVGAIVHYSAREDQHEAAIVTAVSGDNVVNLTVLGDGSTTLRVYSSVRAWDGTGPMHNTWHEPEQG